MRRIFLVFTAVCAPSILLATQPAIRILQPADRSTTEAASVEFTGIALTDSSIVNIYWLDHHGQRGTAQWSASGWRANVPLRPGPNRITVVAVDRENHAGAAQLAIRRDAAPGPQPSEVRSAVWKGRPVTYVVMRETAIVEGDIIIGTGDGGIQPNGFTDSHTNLIWPLAGGVHQIPYTVASGSPNLNAAISYVNSALTGMIQFVPRTSETNYVTFNFDPNDHSYTCLSSVGMIGGQQFISGSVDCAVTGLAHEMGHTMGLFHEHQRPDRNSWITFTPANADKPWLAGNFDFPPTNYQSIGLYGYSSLMHYGPFGFTKNNLPVLESIPAGIPLGNATGYSAGDLDQIARLYGYTPSAVTITTNPAGLQIIVDGVTYAAPQTFAWALNSRHTLNLPADPQQTNPADGSEYAFARWNDAGARSHTISLGGGSGALTAPANKPAVTVYEANFIRLQPFGTSVYPAGTGSVSVSPAPQPVFGGSYFVDRQKITLTAIPNTGQRFYGWFGPPYPQGGNPYPFLIQLPLANAQAGFTTMPVTRISETITGPNTWNPPLYAYVDSNFTYLPQGFSADYSGPAWAAGTNHTIQAPSPDTPVTTNAGYSWNNWSDGGAQTHAITASSSGLKNITASYTPVYRSYAYPQQACATVQYSPSCPNNDCSFPDGTMVTMTATPDPLSGMVFAGWTGDLSGTANPQTTTIHDEFLPVANFNIGPSIISVSSIAPATPVATPGAVDLTVNGTGFVNGSFYTYWDGAYRGNTVISPTQATIHLNAGDLANPGGHDVQVSNFTANCGAAAFTQVLVRATTGTPRLKITKTHQGNFTRGQINATYTVTVTNAATSTGSTSGWVVVSDTIPNGLSLVSMAGTGWQCSGPACYRQNALAPAASYPPITVTVNVSSTAPSSVVNSVTVSGGNSPAAGAADPTTIN